MSSELRRVISELMDRTTCGSLEWEGPWDRDGPNYLWFMVNYQSKVRKWCTIQVAGHTAGRRKFGAANSD